MRSPQSRFGPGWHLKRSEIPGHELKQEISRLSKREHQELQAYLIRLRHNTPEWKEATAKRIKAMQAGRRVTAEELETRVSRA